MEEDRRQNGDDASYSSHSSKIVATRKIEIRKIEKMLLDLELNKNEDEHGRTRLSGIKESHDE